MKPNETFSVFQNDEEALNAAIELDYKNLLKESDNMEKPALKQTSNSWIIRVLGFVLVLILILVILFGCWNFGTIFKRFFLHCNFERKIKTRWINQLCLACFFSMLKSIGINKSFATSFGAVWLYRNYDEFSKMKFLLRLHLNRTHITKRIRTLRLEHAWKRTQKK